MFTPASLSVADVTASPIDQALQFQKDIGALESYYDRWSVTYDSDVEAENYRGPEMIARTLMESLARGGKTTASIRETALVMDACCGTGLVGAVLHEVGFRMLHGCDVSNEMIARARERHIYSKLFSDVDLSGRVTCLPDSTYDLVVCCGAFIPGHLPITGLQELIRICKPHAQIVISVRETYYAEADFESYIRDLLLSGRLSQSTSKMCAPYLDTVCAHYLSFEVHK